MEIQLRKFDMRQITHDKTVVLIGMGGSSLTSFVLSSLFTRDQLDTKFVVLDTIVSSSVESLCQKLDYANTLFIVASKSGETLETNMLYEYFYNQVVLKNGYERAGSFFVAITDNGSDLHTIAEESNFSDIFLNPSDIGGRFSALSYFGIIPALCMGLSVSSVISVTLFDIEILYRFTSLDNLIFPCNKRVVPPSTNSKKLYFKSAKYPRATNISA